MIGSRALGIARPDSDLDLVVLVELPAGARPWGPPERIAERNRIQKAVGVPPISTDLSVRTTDDYHEARGVVGGVEHLVDVEGVEVYMRPLNRRPTIRRTPHQMRRVHAGTWLTHAVDVLVEATAPPAIGPLRADARYSRATSIESAIAAASERAVTALLVTHQLHSAKRDGVRAMLAQLHGVDSQTAGEILALLEDTGEPLATGRAILGVVAQRLRRDPAMAPHLKRAETWLACTLPTPLHGGRAGL
jgi:hypothetical protein